MRFKESYCWFKMTYDTLIWFVQVLYKSKGSGHACKLGVNSSENDEG